LLVGRPLHLYYVGSDGIGPEATFNLRIDERSDEVETYASAGLVVEENEPQ